MPKLSLDLTLNDDGTVDVRWSDTDILTPAIVELRKYLTGCLYFADSMGGADLAYKSLVALHKARCEVKANSDLKCEFLDMRDAAKAKVPPSDVALPNSKIPLPLNELGVPIKTRNIIDDLKAKTLQAGSAEVATSTAE